MQAYLILLALSVKEAGVKAPMNIAGANALAMR